MNRQHKKTPSLVLLITLVGFPQLSETIFTPSLPEIATALGVSMSTTQLTMSIYFFAFAFGVFFWGWLSDRVGRRPAMLYGISIYGLGSFLCLVSPTMELLLLARFIQAFGASTGSVTTQTILRESFDGGQPAYLICSYLCRFSICSCDWSNDRWRSGTVLELSGDLFIFGPFEPRYMGLCLRCAT
ncbi:MFS transporter [Vagococcus allomyrinae]|uniref:MFS transporter n=1 Tax=Vagococcus allomyrinae TaxID=2794353 RepID=UPI0024BF82E2|nr:MFS transporter [Vagococcus allomyrinae]